MTLAESWRIAPAAIALAVLLVLRQRDTVSWRTRHWLTLGALGCALIILARLLAWFL